MNIENPEPLYIPINKREESDRPREKLETLGASALSNAELLAILINTGTKKKSAIDLAQELLGLVGGELDKLHMLTPRQMKEINGIGKAKATFIAAALELSKRRKGDFNLQTENLPQYPVHKDAKLNESKPAITSSLSVFEYYSYQFLDLLHEEFHIILLNRANQIIKAIQLHKGTTTSLSIDLKMIIRNVGDYQASGLIICHNHPSGSLKPSQVDIDVTHRINEVCKMIDCNLLDHLIFSNSGYYSFKDHNIY
ncbi:MAG: DNA repair protein RadC [Bacteroidota bacterium]|nr:DNA repair protein RadC [Bacteroidota bacterium]